MSAGEQPEAEIGAVPDAFRAAATRFAEEAALEAGEERLTYRELDRLSSRVAQALLARGGDEPVAMVAPLVPVSLVVLVGALKAGRLFAPIAPSEPEARRRLLRSELGALALAANDLDELEAELVAERDDDPALPLEPDHPGLVYFTSGSSGRPRGVVKSHRVLAWAHVSYGFSPHDRVALILPLAYAASLTTVFGTLLSGATGCLRDPAGQSAAALSAWIAAAGVTVLKTSPSALAAIAAEATDRGRPIESVRLAIVGGEPSRIEQLVAIRRGFPRATIVNHYGSSEAGYVAYTTIEPGEPLESGTVLRHRFPGQTVEIVDELGRALLPGEEGEVLVRGPCVALGYWGDAATDETHRFVGEPGGPRAVRTGDRGLLRPGGTLELLGRGDLRVSVRGQSVDLGVVERELTELAEVREAVVVPSRAETGDSRLVAYVVAEGGGQPTPGQLRRALASRLPGYMLPSTFFRVDSLPRTERGKVDRHVLREAAVEAVSETSGRGAPRTIAEEAVATLVADVLGLERVGVGDDVFELGIDSLSGVELLAAIGARLAVKLETVDLLEAPTVAELARLVEVGRPPRDRTVVPIRLDGDGAPFFCLAGAGGSVLTLRRLGRRLDRPTYSFLPRALERRGLPDRRVERAAGRYVQALRAVQEHGPYFLGGHSFGALVAYEMAQQLRAAGEEVALLALLDPATQESGLGQRVRRIVAESSSGALPPLAVLPRLAERALRWLRHSVEVATAGLVLRPPERQGKVFVRLSVRMARRYRPEPYRGPALVARTAGWPRIDRLDLVGLLEGPVRAVQMPGGHGSMLREPYVAVLAGALRAAFLAADGERSLAES